MKIICLWVTLIGVVAIGTLGTWALPDKERNLSIRNQKVLKYWAQYKDIRSWCLEGYHFQINACPCLLSSWNIPNSQLVSHFILSQWLSVPNAVLILTRNEKKCPPKKMPQLRLCSQPWTNRLWIACKYRCCLPWKKFYKIMDQYKAAFPKNLWRIFVAILVLLLRMERHKIFLHQMYKMAAGNMNFHLLIGV